jgi:YbbR domain-containing protein
VSVRLEPVDTKVVPVIVVPATLPDGLEARPPQQSIRTATVRGARSDIARVSAARAVVSIDASGLDVNRDFPLSAVDELCEPVRGVDVAPASVGVTMDVFVDRQTKSVPIVPSVVGTLSPGFEVVRVTVSSPVVTVQGDAADLADVANAQTAPISVEGRTTDLEVSVGYDLPPEVTAVNPASVQVRVFIRAVTESRTFNAGIVATGARADRTYRLSVEQALLTLGGSPAELERLSGAALVLTANVADLEVGVHEVPLSIEVEPGLTVAAISPATVTVTVAAAASPAASPSAGP